jgi:hypothetical protein
VSDTPLTLGPLYGAPLPRWDSLPIGGDMEQSLPSRADLEALLKTNVNGKHRICGGYEVLASYYHAEIEKLAAMAKDRDQEKARADRNFEEAISWESSYNRRCQELERELAAVTKERDALRKDKERLQTLIDLAVSFGNVKIETDPSDEDGDLWSIFTWDNEEGMPGVFYYGKTARQAMDKAKEGK